MLSASPNKERIVSPKKTPKDADTTPAAGTAVPVTYEAGGEQYIVIPAGGHSMYQSTLGD